MIGLEFIFEQKKNNNKKDAELALFTEKEGFFKYFFVIVILYVYFLF